MKIILETIDPKDNKDIIDVGGGSGRLERILGKKHVLIYDHNEADIATAKEYFNRVKVGSGKSIEFPDNSFDWAISLHTLEHIPQEDREMFLREMIRVSKEGIVLNFPEGEHAKRICEIYLTSLKKNGRPENRWTKEHLENGLPTYSVLKPYIQKQNKFVYHSFGYRNFNIERIFWHLAGKPNNSFVKFLLSPFIAILSFFFRKISPSTEMILVGSKDLKLLKIFNKSI